MHDRRDASALPLTFIQRREARVSNMAVLVDGAAQRAIDHQGAHRRPRGPGRVDATEQAGSYRFDGRLVMLTQPDSGRAPA